MPEPRRGLDRIGYMQGVRLGVFGMPLCIPGLESRKEYQQFVFTSQGQDWCTYMAVRRKSFHMVGWQTTNPLAGYRDVYCDTENILYFIAKMTMGVLPMVESLI